MQAWRHRECQRTHIQKQEFMWTANDGNSNSSAVVSSSGNGEEVEIDYASMTEWHSYQWHSNGYQ